MKHEQKSVAPTQKVLVTIVLAALSACGSDTGEQPNEGVNAAVCEACKPLSEKAIAELSTGSASPSECEWLSKRTPLDRAGVASAGFDLEAIDRRVSRAIDEKLSWTISAPTAVPSSGFEPSTRIAATVTVADYAVVALDPAFCSGETCRRDEVEVSRSDCSERLEMAATVRVRTADGALDTAVIGTAVQWKPASGGDTDPGSKVIVSASADLSEVHGTLRLDLSEISEPYSGQLALALEMYDDRASGQIVPSLLIERESSGNQLEIPLRAAFPTALAANGSATPR